MKTRFKSICFTERLLNLCGVLFILNENKVLMSGCFTVVHIFCEVKVKYNILNFIFYLERRKKPAYVHLLHGAPLCAGSHFSEVKVISIILLSFIFISYPKRKIVYVHLLHGAPLCAGSHLVISRLNNHAEHYCCCRCK